MKRTAALLVLCLALPVAGCHFSDAMEWLGVRPRAGAATPGETATGAIPGALAGDPISWVRIGGVLAGFLGVAIAGRKVHKKVKAHRARKKAAAGPPPAEGK